MDGRIRKLFDDNILKEAAERFDIAYDNLKELGGFESFIYEFSREEKPYILRITHSSRRTPEMIESEMHWIDYLHRHQVNCSLPLLSQQGNLTETVGEGDRTFVVCAFDKVPGDHLRKEDYNDDFTCQYGKLLGRMHAKTKDYQAGHHKRIHWYEDEMIKGFEDFVPSDQTIVLQKHHENRECIHSIKAHRDNYGLVHYDAHGGNYFVKDNQLYIFDFDDSQYAFFSADIAIVLFYFVMHCPKDMSKETFISHFFKQFMKGYLSENQIDAEEMKYISLFLKQREFLLYAVIYHAYPDGQYDNWATHYMNGRREKLENDIPYIDCDFYSLFKEIEC
ncbi:MAG TPA: phosphotransferase [Candidatus Cloacimonadota bacterium]|nr:phosphotransferase [Candidatus Cloacimonadota bacterium]